jgi:hypothetical protein
MRHATVYPAKTWVFAFFPLIEFLAKMAYGRGMKNQAIGSRDRAREMEILMTTDELIVTPLTGQFQSSNSDR